MFGLPGRMMTVGNRAERPDNRPDNFGNRAERADTRPDNFGNRPERSANRPDNFGNRADYPQRSGKPQGDRPRVPLYMAEVDERTASIKKNTLTVIEDRQPGDTPQIQFSNFSVLENRETGEVELYMTRFGEREDWCMADTYRYTIRLC